MQPKVAFAKDNLNPEEAMTFQEIVFENSFKLEVKLRWLSLNLICLHWPGLQLCKYLGLVLAALAQVFGSVYRCWSTAALTCRISRSISTSQGTHQFHSQT